MTTKFWVRKDGYLHRGSPGGKPEPYEVIREDRYHMPDEVSERYWAMYGLKREAPIVDFEELEEMNAKKNNN